MEPKSFEFTVGGRDVAAEVGRCACVLFRTMGEVDYLAVDIDDDRVLRVFNDTPVTRWLAGYQLGEQDGNLYRPTTRNQDMNGSTFRELYGWNPVVIEKEKPSDTELEMFLDVNTGDLDFEWAGME